MEYVIAIDLGATNLRVGIVSSNLEIVEVNRERSERNDKTVLLNQICRLIDALPYKDYNVKKVGISACGLIEKDHVKILPNLNIRDFDLKGELERRYGFKVEIKNDANCTALAEASFGSTKDVPDSFFFTISSGIGGCLIYNHNMVDLAFEVGHILVPYLGGVEEFEKCASGNGLVKLCKDLHLNVEKAADFFSLAANKDSLALTVLEEWENIVALQLANTQLTYNVDKIVLSGGVMKSSSLFLDALEEKANKIIEAFPVKRVKIVLAQFDQDAGLMGAVSVALAIK
jgi:predicted NBD/HSP70 family sugar kinase